MGYLNWQSPLAGTRVDVTVPGEMSAEQALPSAVLIIITADEAPCLLLTKRSAHLKKHAGQIAFPGGRVDESDESLVHTALREAGEEVGLDASTVSLRGFLPDMLTGTGYLVTPVVVQSAQKAETLAAQLSANPEEVDEIFFAPLSLLLQPENYDSFRREDRGISWRSWRIHYQGHIIWGATAAILHHWARALY